MLRWISHRLEYLFSIYAISILAGGFTHIPRTLSGMQVELGGTNPWNTAAMALLLGGTLVLAYVHRERVLPLMMKGHLVTAFLLLALVSATWSIDPGVTLRRMMPLVACLLFAGYFIAAHSMEVAIDRLAAACLFMAVTSALISAAMPSLGSITVTHPGSWNGIFPHKNSLGQLCVIACITFGWKFWTFPEKRGRYALTLLFLLALCVLSQSKTGLIGSLVGIFAFPLLKLLRVPGLLRLWFFFIFGAGAVLGMAILGLFWTEILTGLGRDPTLTGRIPLWGLLLTFAMEHPLLGYGYSAFWLQWNPDAEFVWQVVQWDAPEAHNAYIDMLLQLGLVGLVISSYTLFWILGRSFRDSLADLKPWSSFVVVYALSFTITNFSETLLYRAGDIYCWMLVLTYFALLREHKAIPVRAPKVQRKWRLTPSRQIS